MKYLLASLVPLSPILGYLAGDSYFFITPLFFFLIVPALDFLFGRDTTQYAEPNSKAGSMKFRIILYFCFLLQLLLVMFGIYLGVLYDGENYFLIGHLVSTGLALGAFGLVSHELSHSTNKWERLISLIGYSSIFYPHYFIEHLSGHHVNYCTPKDVSTSFLGESLYHFIPRSISGSLRNAWRLEKKKATISGRAAWTFKNRFILLMTISLLTLFGIYSIFGSYAALFYIAQGIAALLVIECANYVAHYGLERREISPGVFEKGSVEHAWDTSFWFSSLVLLNLPRHADHHCNPSKPFQLLSYFEKSPKAISGPSGMILLSFFPFLWARIMDPIAIQYRNHLQIEDLDSNCGLKGVLSQKEI
ncbi:hypothetical protein DLM76_12405 [Leptospira yasudae]|uniref:alkane 1-monooxygenase n=1 Tax=Leptospira yasudae TaxID=2202201 RepID=UPI000E59B49A|nr:alkane 1-monooxygenase [Leptospira yasudae]RHX93795.1 hypothetical protein DLM76_12405 [Leptospira yasudae]